MSRQQSTVITAEKALRDAADAARGMYDPPKADCVEWADWLDARADYHADAGSQLSPDARQVFRRFWRFKVKHGRWPRGWGW